MRETPKAGNSLKVPESIAASLAVGYSVAQKRELVHALLDRIRDNQAAMLEVVKKI